jgi:polysaccharide deacetylase family protein (PEP-CTERM system associated)
MTMRRPAGGEIVNAMSVDVEDYFQVSAFDRVVSRAGWDGFESRVVSNTQRVLDLFDRAGVRSTFFVLGWVAERFPALVGNRGGRHEIASHGYNHQLLYMLTPRQFREDVRSSKRVLEDIVGGPVSGFRAPSYSIVKSTIWALDVLIEEGYSYDASIFPIHHDRYGIPNAERHAHVLRRRSGALIELPASTMRVGGVNLPIAGGGYFRLLPYAWTRWGIGRVNRRERKPVVFYFHPWEIDPGQPRFAVGKACRIRHYSGLDRTSARLWRLPLDRRIPVRRDSGEPGSHTSRRRIAARRPEWRRRSNPAPQSSRVPLPRPQDCERGYRGRSRRL